VGVAGEIVRDGGARFGFSQSDEGRSWVEEREDESGVTPWLVGGRDFRTDVPSEVEEGFMAVMLRMSRGPPSLYVLPIGSVSGRGDPDAFRETYSFFRRNK
jgi:hypothetical protein